MFKIEHWIVIWYYLLNRLLKMNKKKAAIFIILLTTFFEYYRNNLWILFVWVTSAKQGSHCHSIFLNIIRILFVYFLTWKTGLKFITHYKQYFEYYPNIFGILFEYVETAKQLSYNLLCYIYFWIIFEYSSNLINIQHSKISILH